MKRLLFMPFVLTASGCGLLDTSSSSSSSATLSAQTDAGESGTTVLTSLSDDETQITVSVSGAGSNVQSVAMRSGTCGSNGDLFAELNNVQGGASVTTIDKAISSLTGGKYYIDVHSATDVTLVVACGEIP